MALVFADRVKEQSTTTGTGVFALAGAFSGFTTFVAAIGLTNETHYVIVDDTTNEWEVGQGTVGAGSLSRDTVFSSSNGGALVVFGVGTKTTFSTSASQFYGTALSIANHAATNHTGLPGVPVAETFTAPIHSATDHTAFPFNLLNLTAHGNVDHTDPPLSLLDTPGHAGIDHEGITGVPAAEAFTSGVHAGTNHTGIDGVISVPTRSYTIEFAAPQFPIVTDTVPFYWRPGLGPGTVGAAGRYPIPVAGRVTVGVLDTMAASAPTTIQVDVNGAPVHTFVVGVGPSISLPVWVVFPVAAADYVEVQCTVGGSYSGSLVMFVEP